jgi:long-chain acyl-CoA synthetase
MNSIISYFEERVLRFGSNPLIWEKAEGHYKSTSYQDIHKSVRTYAAGFIKLGVQHGDRIALLSEGRKDWLVAELAILYTGAINVPLSTKLEADNDLVFRIHHSESRIVIVSRFQLPKIRKVIHQLPLVEKVIVFDSTTENQEKEMIWLEVFNLGIELITDQPELAETRRSQVRPQDVANISYTSGTTADPKGIMLSHRNYTANVEQAFSYINIPADYRTLVVLPWDHAFAHTAALYAFMYNGASIAAVQTGSNPTETLKNFTNNMLEVQPHVLMSVPALAKNFRKGIEKGVQGKGKLAWILFRMAMAHAFWYNGTGNNRGKGLKILTRPLGNLFNKVLFKTIRSKFGGNLQFFIGGGALLDIDLQKFFYALGIPMYQGYGLSEAAPIISANTPDFHKMGSSGKIVHNLELKICDEQGQEVPKGHSGEIVVRGENVMLGYWKNETASQDTVKNGWLFTGDLGYVDSDGYLYVLGRYKSLLIGHDGEKYSPEGIEEAVIDHCALIDQFLLYNNQSAYTTGLVVPNAEKVKQYLKHHHTVEDPATLVINAIKTELSQFKKGGKLENMFPQRWLPTAVAIVPEPFTESNKMLNSTMKVVRREVEKVWHDDIEFLYTPEGKEMLNQRNLRNIAGFIK